MERINIFFKGIYNPNFHGICYLIESKLYITHEEWQVNAPQAIFLVFKAIEGISMQILIIFPRNEFNL